MKLTKTRLVSALLLVFLFFNIGSSALISNAYSGEHKLIMSLPEIQPGIGLKTYSPQFDVYSVVDQMTLTPIFTPDNALGVYEYWLSRANSSINVETQYISKFNDSLSWDKDPSPIVRGLVAAHDRGVSVRVIVNEDLDTDDVTSYFEGLGIPIRWMGANNSYPERLTFTHNKFISIDGKVTILSSANFGPNAFYNNREAGMVIQHQGLTNYYDQVFELDWKMSAPDESGEPGGTLQAMNKDPLFFGDIHSINYSLDYSTNFQPTDFTGTYNATAFIGPDNVDKVVFDYLKQAKKSIYVTMYTISRFDFVDTLIALKKSNPSLDIKVLISHDRVGYTEDIDTVAAAKKLTAALIPVRNTTKDFRFTHAKYWIIDGKYTFVYTGNWSPRSAPPAESSYGSSDVNRDMGIAVVGEDIASYYTTVFNSDWEAGTPWPLPVGVSLSLQNADVVRGNIKVSITANMVQDVKYSIDNGAWISATAVTDTNYEFYWNTEDYENGIHTVSAKGTYNEQEFSQTVKVNVVNTGDDWRLLVTEVLYDAEGTDSGREYFEISNTFPFDLYIEGWAAGDASLTMFPDGFIIKAKTSVVFCQDFTLFKEAYGVDGDLLGSFSLTNTGDYVQLVDNRGNVIDAVAWGDETAPDGSTTFTGEATDGKSLSRDPLWKDTNNSNEDFIVTDPNPKQPITSVPPIGSTEDTETTLPFSTGFTYFVLLAALPVFSILYRKRSTKK